jgi:tryptophan synthase alpha chain
MNRITATFTTLKAQNRKALIAYMVAGDPSLQATHALAEGLAEAGVDLLELGIPFSDPLADGTVNQKGCQRALDSGTTLEGIFNMIAELRKTVSIPIVFFSYFNPIFHYGVERFLERSLTVGVDGILALDLPPEEADNVWARFPDIARISLVAPTTPEARMRQIAHNSSGFIYYVSREGVTGMQSTVPTHLAEKVSLLKSMTPLPVCVGFGISSPEQAKQVASLADGVVVGSAIVSRIEKLGPSPDLVREVSQWVKTMAEAIHSV